MFAFLSYNGQEPGWARALRESDLTAAMNFKVYSPAIPLEAQIEKLQDAITAREPTQIAADNALLFRLDPSHFASLEEALPGLLAADRWYDTGQIIWRDLYLLLRSDVLLVEAGSTNELPVLAGLWGIPVVAVSYVPQGIHPWLTHCAQITINSPGNIGEILDVVQTLVVRSKRQSPPEEPETPEEPEEPTPEE